MPVPAISTIAAIRFGTGLSPHIAAPDGAAALLAGLAGPDGMAAAFPVPGLAAGVPLAREYLAVRAARRGLLKAGGSKAEVKAAGKVVAKVRRRLEAAQGRAGLLTLCRGIVAEHGFRERLVAFWADHFTVRAKNSYEREGPAAYVEEAVRPHVAGRFGDMLVAAATHPVMLVYLDQVSSFGPNSEFARRHNRGLNENLAREVLELHTLGVDGGYSQADVTSFAKLLTGLSYSVDEGFAFRPALAEPGAELVLGHSYGGPGAARLGDLVAALQDLAVHPDTARHLARKLAVHFVADVPDAGLVAQMADAYAASGGDLMVTCGAMLDHPAAWQDFGAKARQPSDFMVASLRALDVDPERLLALDHKRALQFLLEPMRLMGQPFQEPTGPNGWPEAPEAWINPQGLAARIQWAMQVPVRLQPALPDPRRFVAVALADAAGPAVLQAAERAETVDQGVGLVLASPEFNRR